MFQSKFKNRLRFIFPLVTLFSCGKSSGSKDNIINSNSDVLGTSDKQIQSVALNSKNLLSYNSSDIQYFTGQLRTTERLEVAEFNQAFSESYSLEWKNNVRSIQNSNNSEIDGLTYNINGSVQIYDTTISKFISFSFFDTQKKLLSEIAYKSSDLHQIVYNNGFIEFTDDQKTAVKAALAEYEKIIDVKFVEVEEIGDQVGAIRFGISTGDFGSAAAFAVTPTDYWPDSSDVWVSYEHIAGSSLEQGSDYNFYLFMHEIGHALGLSHPHEPKDIFNNSLDSREFTIMSYNDPDWAYVNFGNTKIYTISNTLMVYDIQALQTLYGPNREFNTHNTLYSFDASKPFSMTIWDAGGEDFMDFTNFDLGCEINLNEGEYSTIRYYDWNAENNLGIAFNTKIENVAGSQGDDIIYGNSLDNEIMGYNGNDQMYGGPGNDLFDLAANSRNGQDIMFGGYGDDYYFFGEDIDLVFEYENQGKDRIYLAETTEYTLPENIEELFGFGSASLNLSGNELDNTLRGGAGDDRLTGNSGADNFLLYADMGNDIVTDFDSSEGDEVLLAYGLNSYEYIELSTSVIYRLSDGSSLELIFNTDTEII